MRKILIVAMAVMIILNMGLTAMAMEAVPDNAAAAVDSGVQVVEGMTEAAVESVDAVPSTAEAPLSEDAGVEAQADSAQEGTRKDTSEHGWYEITRDEMGADVLTVRLPGNSTTGFNWMFDISDPAMLELLTQEYVEHEHAEGMVGVGGTWIASFRSFSATAGHVTLALGYGRSWEEEPIELHVMEMEINELGQIEAVQVDSGDDLRDFYNPEGYDMLHVTNVFTGEDGVLRLQASFGSVSEGGEFAGFDDENSYLFAVIPECVLMLPEDMENPVENLRFEATLLDWYSKARAAWALEGSALDFYASYEMNDSAEITYLSYVYMP